MKILSPTFSTKFRLISTLLRGLNNILNRKDGFSRTTHLLPWCVGWKKYLAFFVLVWNLILEGYPAYATEGSDKNGKTLPRQQATQNLPSFGVKIDIQPSVLEIPRDYLIPFMKEALQLSTSRTPSPSSVKIKEDLVEGPDNRDYVRLLNIRLLFAGQQQSVEIQKRWHWLLNLSRQVDALNIHDGSLRDLMTPSDNDGIFWRRIAYLHHGFSIPELATPVRDYLLNQIWSSGDLLQLGKLVEEFFQRNIFQHRCESSRIKSEWLNRMSIVLAWPSLVPLSWHCLSRIPLRERVINFHSLLRQYNLRSTSDDRSDRSRDEVESMLIHPYLKAEAHHNQQFKIFSDRIQTVMRRSREINKENFDRKGYDKLQSEINELTKQINSLQTQIRDLKKQKILLSDEPDKTLLLNEKVEILQKLKEERKKKEGELDKDGHTIDTTINELIENFEAFGSVQLEGLSKHFEEYHRAISLLSFDNISFYIGLVSEFEHLKIANMYLERILAAKSVEPDTILQGLAVIAETLNNVFLPAISDDEDLAYFKEIFRFFRNKVVEHKTVLAKTKLDELLGYPKLASVLEEVCNDLKKVKIRILARFQRLDHIVKAGHEWERNIEDLKEIYSKKIQKPAKDEQIAWKDLGIPALSGLMRYFTHKTYKVEELLVGGAAQVSQIQQRVLEDEKPPKYLVQDKVKDNTESSTLQELRRYINEIDFLIGNVLNISILKGRLESEFNFRLKFIRTVNHIKESFSYLAENMEEEYLTQVLTVFDEEVLWHLYYDLRDRRNLVTHDLWRSDLDGLIATALRIQNILKPAVMRKSESKGYSIIPKLGKDLAATQKLFEHLNAETNNIDVVETLTNGHHADVNGIDPKNRTPLYYAVKRSDSRLVEFLLRSGANPNVIINRKGDTLLHVVLKKHYDKAIAELLIKYGALSDTRNAEGDTPFRIVLKRAPSEDLSTKYQPRFKLPALSDESSPFRILEDLRSQQGYQRGLEADRLHTELRVASSRETIETLRRLIEQEGYDVNLYDEYGEIPLCLALGRRFKTEDSCEFLRLLLSQGSANPDCQNYIGIQESAFHLAAQRASTKPIRILLDHHANPSLPNVEQTTPLHYAVGLRNFDIASLLLTSGANIHARDCFELTPILVCAPEYLEMLALLLTKGANPNDRAPYSGTLLENVEGMLDIESLTYGKAASLYKTRQLLLEQGAYPIIRMTPLIFTTIAYQLKFLRSSSSSSVLPTLRETYDFERMCVRLENYLSARKGIFTTSEVEKEKEQLIRKKTKNRKKFIVVVGPQITQDQVSQNMIQTIETAGLTNIEIKQLIQLIPGNEQVIADPATESLQCLTDASVQLLEEEQGGESDSEEEFREDYSHTQELLRQTLLMSLTTIPSDLSNTEIVDLMSLKAKEFKSAKSHKLKTFMSARQDFNKSLYRPRSSLHSCYYNAQNQHFTYFGLNPKTPLMILKRIARLSHLSLIEKLVLNDLMLPWPDFGKGKKVRISKNLPKSLTEETFEKYPAWNHRIIGNGMLEALTHAWHPYGARARVQVWERVGDTSHIIPTGSIGSMASNDVIHFLKVNAHGDMLEHYMPIDIMEYDYTGRDIQFLIQASLLKILGGSGDVVRYEIDQHDQLQPTKQGHPISELIIYKIKNLFILPPAENCPDFKLEKYIEGHLKKIDQLGLFTFTTEILIPYNPGGHWVTIYVRRDQGRILISYIDSRHNSSREVEEVRKSIIAGNIQKLTRLIEKKFRLKQPPEEKIKIKAETEIVSRRIQQDNHACGVLTVENILDIVLNRSVAFPPNTQIADQINSPRELHHLLLLQSGCDLDFDIAQTKVTELSSH